MLQQRKKKPQIAARREKQTGLALLSNTISHKIMPRSLRAAADAARR